MNNLIDKVVNQYKKELVNIRRDFHKNAEVGWEEFRTASKIAEYLESIGLNIKLGEHIFNNEYMLGLPSKVELEKSKKRAINQGGIKKYIDKMGMAYTGVVGILDTKRPGPTIAFRFDIDANEMEEGTSKEHRPFSEGFASINKGAMHACGHDGHAAIGMVLAKVLKEVENKLIGRIKFIFQPAEEGVRGALAMVNRGILDDVDYFLCGHIGFSATKIGQIVCNTYGFMATTKIDIEFEGKSSHAGACPQKGNNALLAAATAALNLHTLCQHEEGMARINVGVLNAGTGRNIIPSKAKVKLETRGENNEINDYINKRTIDIIKGSSLMHNVLYKVNIVGKSTDGKSDRELSCRVKEVCKNIHEINEIIAHSKLNGSEDATYMMNRVQQKGGKAAYLIFGTEKSAEHHNSLFDFNEKVLEIAVKVFANIAMKINRGGD
ncbi:amidohydrolase [Clostridium rectalis]|uniref:amidohydrolase n=1 Tax=Clostridium rectalis TaxID=2040295 RepID=UPI000F6371DA|nr:amidohydrolase [Clostridium rectalis]